MNITLLITDNCPACTRVENNLRRLIKNLTKVNLRTKDCNEEIDTQACIVPAVFIEKELYSYGDPDYDKLLGYITGELRE